MPNPLIVIGAGGLGTEYLWVAELMHCVEWRIAGYADDDAEKWDRTIGRYRVHGNVEAAARKFAGEEVAFLAAVGNNASREKLVRQAEAAGWQAATLIHPSAIVAPDAEVGAGAYVAPGCVIGPGAKVGRHVIVNTHVSVGHDSELGDYSQICPGARVSGGCRVGRGGFLGSNASLGPGISVGDGAVVGANSHAIRSVPAGVTVVGCPARRLLCQNNVGRPILAAVGF